MTLLEPFYKTMGKRLAKTPKLLFSDTGLATFLAGFADTRALEGSPQAGAFWENYVIGQWTRWREWSMPSSALWYWQDQSRNEVDLVVETNGRLYPIECKWKERPTIDDTRNLRRFLDFYGAELVPRSFIASLCEQPFEVSLAITAMNGREVFDIA